MKKAILFFVFVLLTMAAAFSQTATLSYQAVVRDSHNKFVRNTDIDVEVSISVESTERYYETRTVHTNQNGVVSFSIGGDGRTWPVAGHPSDDLASITGWRNATISVTFHLSDGDVTTNSPVSAVPYALEVNPTLLPTVNDATLTIQKNGATAGAFTANQATDQTVNITVPTCDSLNDCDLIKDILNRLDRLEQLSDSLARELDSMKLSLTVTTDSISTSTIAATTAKAYGRVVADGGRPNTKRGMLYSTSDQNLKIGTNGVDSVLAIGTGKGSYACDLKRLTPCTQYYVRAFAFNDVDTAYGEVKSFTTLSFTCGSTLTDIDGNEYETLLLGSQCWMKQNLRTTHFADGTEIPVGGVDNHSGARRYAPNSNLNTYGYLYNWDAAMNGSASSTANPSGVQGVCPAGWHLPSDAEWTQLTSFVASNSANVCDNNPTYIAKSLVSTEDWGTWGSCSSITTNNTGFSVLPAGTWHVNGASGHIDQGYTDGYSIFRTATGYEGNYVWVREFYTEYPYVGRTAIDKTNGLSVRCVLTCPTNTAYLPTVSAVTLSATGATVSMTSNVLSDGGATVTERGVCWSTSPQPTTSSDHTADSGTGTGSFTVTGSLTPGTTYYVRAYATNSEGTAYGAEVTYVAPILPTVTTSEVSSISATTATAGGSATVSDGGAPVTARGVCWSTSQNPTVSDSHTTDGSGTGSFTSNITGLNALTTYYVRAYATNNAGTTYGNQLSFTTTEALPVVTTSAVSNISLDNSTINATCGGNVTDEGASAVTARGVCWSTSQNPTVSDSHTTDGSGTSSFTSSITGLTSGTTYYVRAYATNNAGTAYGNQVTLTLPVVDEKSCPSAPTVTDHEGNVYATVLIGTQCWMRENLRTTTSPSTHTYLIPAASAGPTYTGKQARWYNNDSITYAPLKYGLLYNWNAAVDTFNTSYGETSVNNTPDNAVVESFTGNRQGICPAGWHLPVISEWNSFKSAVSSATNALATGANTSGFSAYIAGFYKPSSPNFQENYTYFWAAGSVNSGYKRSQSLFMTTGMINTGLSDMNRGFSVRCIKD